MGKQKRARSHHAKPSISPPPPPSESIPSPTKEDSVSNEKSLLSVDTEQNTITSSVMDITDSSMKLPNNHPSHASHHYNLSRSLFLKRSRHYYGHQYFRRKSGNCASPSTSHGKGTPLRDDRLSFKLASQCNSPNVGSSDNWEKALARQEIIRSCSTVKDKISSDIANMVCSICQKFLRRKPISFGSALSSSEFSVVAVLVCGHSYHAECLEQQTCHEYRQDPPCPICASSSHLDGDDSRGQE